MQIKYFRGIGHRFCRKATSLCLLSLGVWLLTSYGTYFYNDQTDSNQVQHLPPIEILVIDPMETRQVSGHTTEMKSKLYPHMHIQGEVKYSIVIWIHT